MFRRREKLNLRTWWQVLLLCLGFSVLSVLSVMLFAAMESVLAGKAAVFGAVSTYGAYFFCPILLLLAGRLFRWKWAHLFDLYALYAIPSLFFVRCNCLIAGCCSGLPIPGTHLHWPTREVELLFYVVLLLLLLRKERTDRRPGRLFPLLMLAYGTFRFLEEGFRISDAAGVWHMAHTWSLLCALIGAGLYLELGSRAARTARTKKGGK